MSAPLSLPAAVRQAKAALVVADMVQAAHLSKIIVSAAPEMPEGWRILGQAASGLKNFELAAKAFEEAARLSPVGSEQQVHDLLARIEPLICLGRPPDAMACLRKALAIGLTAPRDFFLAALAFSHFGLPSEALPLAERAVVLDSNLAEAWFIIGNARQFLGEIDAAERAFSEVIARSRDHAAAAYYSLAHLQRWKSGNSHIRQLETFPCRNSLEASRIGYALFKEYDDAGNTDAAWDCLQHAARVGRVMETWSDATEQRCFDTWKKSFPDKGPRAGDTRRRAGPRRIFIVGLPRSGTTLVERILTSHSQVQTIGEVNSFAIATRRISHPSSPGIVNPEIIAAARRVDPLAIASEYTTQTAYLHDGSAYTVDKRPDNYEYIGLIGRAFPGAIVIVLDRNPMDALFGAYKRAFAPGSHGWSYTLDDLAAHYHNFRSLIEHWKVVPGGRIVEVSLESLIADPETEIHRLLDRCGLPFEASCLHPHEAKGAVTTASALQVRQPINAHGVGAWKRYGRQLQPLRQRLASLGYDV